MSRVHKLLQQMPSKERSSIETGRAEALEIDLGTDEPIVAMARSSFRFGTMVVTPRRLVVLLQDGGSQVINYSDIARLEVVEGAKKLLGLGSRGDTTLIVHYRSGTERDAILVGRDGDWGLQVSREIVQRHELYVIKNG
jgi:hypothetical protein